MFVESGGDNLTAIFSPALADVQAFVIDVAAGDDIPRKGGPGISRADLLVINKTDLAPLRRRRRRLDARRVARAPRGAAGRADVAARPGGRRARRRLGARRGSRRSAPTATCTRARKVLPTTTTRTHATEIAVQRGRVAGAAAAAPGSRRGCSRRGPVVRAALVPTQAGPLDGDHDRVASARRAGRDARARADRGDARAARRRARLELDATVEAAAGWCSTSRR